MRWWSWKTSGVAVREDSRLLGQGVDVLKVAALVASDGEAFALATCKIGKADGADADFHVGQQALTSFLN